MKIPSVLPLTAAQSRASRFQLGLTQADVIEQSKLPGYKLKQFETGRFVPDIPFLQNLHDFYQEKGIDLSEAETASTKTDAVADDVKSGVK
jgi:transcriptional regulator with XRE-family HTH domain